MRTQRIRVILLSVFMYLLIIIMCSGCSSRSSIIKFNKLNEIQQKELLASKEISLYCPSNICDEIVLLLKNEGFIIQKRYVPAKKITDNYEILFDITKGKTDYCCWQGTYSLACRRSHVRGYPCCKLYDANFLLIHKSIKNNLWKRKVRILLSGTGVNPIDCTKCDRVLDRINTPRGQKGSCHEIQEVHSGI